MEIKDLYQIFLQSAGVNTDTRTLKENHLKVLETIVPISARLIANRASYLFKNDVITAITQKLQEVLPQ